MKVSVVIYSQTHAYNFILTSTNRDYLLMHTVGNKAKGRILKRVFQENKTGQIFRKTNIFYLLIRTRIKNIPISEI